MKSDGRTMTMSRKETSGWYLRLDEYEQSIPTESTYQTNKLKKASEHAHKLAAIVEELEHEPTLSLKP